MLFRSADPACALALIEAHEALAFQQALGPIRPLALSVVTGFNYNTGRPVALTLYRLAPAPAGPGDGPAAPGGSGDAVVR